ncbi:11523_t:CDS:2 [Entrophospora sp. SA101]|nr:11523_t:CDS:2 [Entrophospora sp. SA101]
MLHNTNTSTRRRRRNRTPPPSYEVSTILSTSRRESTTNQRNRSASPTQRATSERSENISETATTNNNQDNRRNENTSETATTNNNQDNTRNENTSETVTTGNNQDNGNNVNNVNDVSENSGHNVNDVDENLDNVRYLSSSELANITSSINISASQNDSDVSMFDVEDTHEKEIQELKSQVSDLKKRLQSALKDVDKKEGFLLNRERQLTILEDEVIILKNKIQKNTSRKYNKPVMAQTIQAPGSNESQTTYESVRNAFRNIDAILRRTPAIPRSTIENEFTDIKNAVARLRDIAEWENTQSQIYYQQIGNLTNQLANTNNNFDLINQAYNFQTGQLQNSQADLQNWRRKHVKRKGKH